MTDPATSGNRYWVGTSSAKGGYPNLTDLFKNYCKDLSVERGDHKAFLDPTCNLFYSPDQCVYSAFWNDNRVDHRTDPRRAEFIRQDKKEGGANMFSIFEARGSITSSVPDPPTNCLCTGAPSEYAKNNLNDGHSFVEVIENRDKCQALNYVINDCSIHVGVGGSVDEFAGNTIQNNCGIDAVDDPVDDPVDDGVNVIEGNFVGPEHLYEFAGIWEANGTQFTVTNGKYRSSTIRKTADAWIIEPTNPTWTLVAWSSTEATWNTGGSDNVVWTRVTEGGGGDANESGSGGMWNNVQRFMAARKTSELVAAAVVVAVAVAAIHGRKRPAVPQPTPLYYQR
jgi:hypothetical protein